MNPHGHRGRPFITDDSEIEKTERANLEKGRNKLDKALKTDVRT